MEAVAHEIAERLRPAPFVRIVTHIDTDGITGGAIASEALDRAGISHEVAFVKKLDEAVITDLKRQGTPLVWFIDLGAGMLHALHGLDAVITDHHVPTEREVPKALRGDLPFRRNMMVRDDRVEAVQRSEEHTSELQSPCNLVCRLLLEK